MDNTVLRGKIKAAFADLRKKGLIALMNFRCCQNCATTEISEMLKARPKTTGYVFYHKQDAEMFVKTGKVYLGFGGRGDDDRQSIRVGHEVVDALRAHGLKVDWDNDTGHRILIEGVA